MTTQHPIFTPMHFFKSFSLLHRRSKSDTALTSRAQATSNAILVIGPSCDIPSSLIDITVNEPKTQPFASFNQRVFEAELENQHLTHLNSSLALRLTLAETQLQLTISELYAEMHKSVQLHRQTLKDKDTISELQKTCQQYRHSLSVFPDLAGLHFSRTSLASSPQQSSSPAVWTSDEQHYSTALKLVLKTRQELRINKKIAMFWKRKAKTILKYADLITPSPSDISEVQDVLSKERREAVNALQRRRQMMPSSGTQITLPPTRFPESTPKLVPPVPSTTVDGQLYGFEYTQSYRSFQEPWNSVTEDQERVISAHQNKLRRRAGSVDLRQSASFASA